MAAMASKFTGASIVYSTVCTDADQRKYQSVTGLSEGISPVTGRFPTQRASKAEKFPIDDVFLYYKETPR